MNLQETLDASLCLHTHHHNAHVDNALLVLMMVLLTILQEAVRWNTQAGSMCVPPCCRKDATVVLGLEFKPCFPVAAVSMVYRCRAGTIDA